MVSHPIRRGRVRAALFLSFVAACGVAAACTSGAVPPATSPHVAPLTPLTSADLLYVCNQNDATVSVIDMSTNRVVRVVDLQRLGFSAQAKPHHVAVEPDGSFWYVTLIGENRIVKLNRADRVVAQVTFETPGMLALHPTADLLFVGRSMTAINPPPRIGVVRRSDMTIEELPVFFARPHALALEPRSGTVYTASLATNQLAAVNVATEDVKLVDLAGPSHALMQFAISPDGRTAVISGELSHTVFVLDITNPSEPRITAQIDVEPQPFDPVFTLDGRWVYLGNKAANAITVVDMSTHTVANVIRGNGIAQPHGVAASPDGRYIYVSNNNTGQVHDMGAHAAHVTPPAPPTAAPPGKGTVVVIDTRTRTVAHVIEVGHNATGIGTRTRR